MTSVKFVSLVILVSLVSACQQVPTQDGSSNTSSYQRVTTDVLPSIFNKKLSLNGNFLTISADGSFSGSWEDKSMMGTWTMENDYFCRTLTQFFKPESTGTKDCQLWELKDDKLRASRNKGKGKSFTYKISQ